LLPADGYGAVFVLLGCLAFILPIPDASRYAVFWALLLYLGRHLALQCSTGVEWIGKDHGLR
jgi:hypothetical protein